MEIFVPYAPWMMKAAQTLVLAGLFVLLWRAFDGREALATLRRADPIWLAAAALALSFQTALSAQRWRITARQLGLTMSAGRALREYYLGQVINQALPGGVVGDAGRAVRARSQAGLLVSAQAVLFERLAGQLGLICFMLAGLVFLGLSPTAAWPAWLTGTVVSLLAVFAAIPVAIWAGLRVLGPSAAALRRFVDGFKHAIFGKAVLGQQVALSLGTAACNIAGFVFCATALDIGLPVLALAAIVPLILFVMLIPLTLSGWGVRELAAVALFPVIGGTPSDGLATSVAFGLVFLVVVLPGVLIPLWQRSAESRPPGVASQMRADRTP